MEKEIVLEMTKIKNGKERKYHTLYYSDKNTSSIQFYNDLVQHYPTMTELKKGIFLEASSNKVNRNNKNTIYNKEWCIFSTEA